MSFHKISIISFDLSSSSSISSDAILAHTQSIARQDYTHIEHIIICPQEQVKNLSGDLPNVKFISNSDPKIANDLNQAIKIASADIIGFVDVNSFFANDSIAKTFAAFNNADVVIPSNELLDSKQFFFNYLKYWNNNINAKTVFAKKSIIQSALFFDKTLFDVTFNYHYLSDLILRFCTLTDKVFLSPDLNKNADFTSDSQIDLRSLCLVEMRRLFRKFEKVNCGYESRFTYVFPITEYTVAVEELISSVEKQNFPDIEVIVVGMSCDHRTTQKKLRLYEDNLRKTSLRYVPIDSQNVEHAFIAGCRAARSTLISCIVDSPLDDMYFTRKILAKFENDAVGAISLSANNFAIRKFAYDDFEVFGNPQVNSVSINEILNQLPSLTWRVLKEST